MIRSVRAALTGLVVGGLVATGATVVAAAPASAATSWPPPAPVTCNDPITGITFIASWIGTAGDDMVIGQPAGVLAAGPGNDVVITDFAAPVMVACLGDDDDWLGASGQQVDPTSGFANGRVGVRGEYGGDVIWGTTGNDVLVGDGAVDSTGKIDLLNGGNDSLMGGPGDDTLMGGPGDDMLTGGPETDRVDGGPGFDTCEAEFPTNCEVIVPGPVVR